MDPERIFSLASAAVMPGWLVLVFLPRWRHGARLIVGVLIPALLGVLYTVLLLGNISGSDGDFGSLAGVQSFFANPWLLLAGWVHYLAFDLFVGVWEVRDAQRVGVPHLVVVPCLAATLMAGPAGLLLYLLLRAVLKRRLEWSDGEPEVA